VTHNIKPVATTSRQSRDTVQDEVPLPDEETYKTGFQQSSKQINVTLKKKLS